MNFIDLGAGFAVGVFTPGIGRKLKALFVEYGTKLKMYFASKF